MYQLFAIDSTFERTCVNWIHASKTTMDGMQSGGVWWDDFMEGVKRLLSRGDTATRSQLDFFGGHHVARVFL